MSLFFQLYFQIRFLDIKKGDGHYWALLNLAALFWRVNGNYHAAITCLIQALDYSPKNAEVFSIKILISSIKRL